MGTTNTENINLNLNINSGDGLKSLRQMRNELKDLQTQMDEAAARGDKPLLQNLQKQFGELKNDISDLNKELKFSDPGEFLAGFTMVAKGAVAGFGAVTGAMELFGASTEDVQEVQKKSMVIIQTLQSLEEVRSLLEAKGAVRGLANSAMRVLGLTSQVAATEAVAAANVQATATQWSWNAAMAANPIGVLVVAIAALAAGIYGLTQIMGDNDEVVQQSFINYAELEKTMKDLNEKGVQSKLRMDLQLKRISQEQYDREILKMQQIAERSDLYDKQSLEKRALYNEWKRKIDEAHEDDQKMLTERAIFDLNNLNKAHAEQTKQLKNTQVQDTITLLQKQRDAEAKSNADSLKNVEETERKKREAYNKTNVTQLKLIDKTGNEYIDKEMEMLDSAYKNTDAQLVQMYKVAESKRAINSELQSEYLDQLDSMLQAEIEKEDFFRQLKLENAQTDQEEYDAKVEIIDAQRIEELAKYGDTKEQEHEINKKYDRMLGDLNDARKQKQIQDALEVGAILKGGISDLMSFELEEAGDNEEKKKAIRKKYAGVQALIDIATTTAQVYMAASAALSPPPIGAGPILGPILAGVTIASGMAKVALVAQQYQKIMKAEKGMFLKGPSHAQGGIMLEAEGGEAIINANSMRNPMLRALASDINVAGGGVPFVNNTNYGNSIASMANTAVIDPASIDNIVSKIASIPVIVTEYDITKTQRKVQVIEQRAQF